MLWLQKLDKQERWVCGEKIDVSETDKHYENIVKVFKKQLKRQENNVFISKTHKKQAVCTKQKKRRHTASMSGRKAIIRNRGMWEMYGVQKANPKTMAS